MSVLELYKTGKLTALLTWHGTFVKHIHVGDTLCHQSLDLASGEQPNLLLDSASLEDHTPDGFLDGFWFTKVKSLPIAFPNLRFFSSNDGFTSFQCTDGYNLYPNGKGHLMTAEENTGRICMDRDVEKDWERFMPVSFRLMSGLSVLMARGRLASQVKGSIGKFSLHIGATVTCGNHVFPINVNRDLILRISINNITTQTSSLAKTTPMFIRDNMGSDYEVLL